MAQNVTQYCHVCKSETTSGPPVHFLEVFALWSLKLSVVFVHVCWLRPGGSICSENILSNTHTVFHHISNTARFFRSTSLRVVFSTLFLVFENVLEHGLSCLMYHLISTITCIYTMNTTVIPGTNHHAGIFGCFGTFTNKACVFFVSTIR